MAQYDPQRSRTRHRKADDEGPAPVDALLGPEPSAAPVDPAPNHVAATSAPSAADAQGELERFEIDRLEPETALDVARSLTSRGPTIWLTVSAGLAATVGLVWVVLRGRRRARGRARAAGDATR
jgi:hypothetical protein